MGSVMILIEEELSHQSEVTKMVKEQRYVSLDRTIKGIKLGRNSL